METRHRLLQETLKAKHTGRETLKRAKPEPQKINITTRKLISARK